MPFLSIGLRQSNRFAVIGLALLLLACEPYEPALVGDAVVQLSFENNLDNLGGAPIRLEAHDGKAGFKKSKTGNAFFAQGDGSWLEATLTESLTLGDIAEVSFDFKRADWTNLYKPGSGTQTLVAISGRGEQKIQHLAFNISTGSVPSLYAVVEDADGKNHRLMSPAGAVSPGWHRVRLRINKNPKRVSFYLDDTLVAEGDMVPAVFQNGVERIKFGTWHKKNQAYRGHIDNFVIREISQTAS